MKDPPRRERSRLLTKMAFAALAAAVAAPAWGQQRQQQTRPGGANRAVPAQPPASAARAPAESATGGGLNSISDDALISELAGRGQESLLDRAFDVNKTPAEPRAGLRAFGALRELGNRQKPPSAARRQALVGQLVAGARSVLPTLKDPAKL